MLRLIPAVLALTISAAAVHADEFTDVVEGALEAYRAGDITGAQQELDYANTLLREMKTASLANHLPEAPDGWTREDNSDAQSGAGFGLAMLGGGNTAAATYRRGGEDMTVTLVANSPMVSGMSAMITGMGAISGGRPMRIQRVQVANHDGELQGVIDGRLLVTVAGNASVEDKVALLETMDFSALSAF